MKKNSFQVITLFPELIQAYLRDALLAKAILKGLIEVKAIDLRAYSQNKYNSVDDTVFGGGDGMLLSYKPLELALKEAKVGHVVYLSPQGKPWTAARAKQFAKLDQVTLICGRYAGIDQRVIHDFVDEEISLGDFVLSGGEVAALAIIESVSRFIPGVLGDAESANADSFENGLLEAPQFTKPQIENNLSVPTTLVSGNHQKIAEWRKNVSILMTLKKRPDLLQNRSEIDWKVVSRFYQEMDLNEKEILEIQDLEIPNA